MAGEQKSFLTPTQRYGAGALFAIALNQAQIHQTRLLGLSPEDDDPSNGERTSSSSSNDSVSEDPDLWVHENSGLLRPIFRFLDIDSAAWHGLEETGGASPAKHHVGAFLRLLAEESEEGSSERLEQEIALSKAVDAMTFGMETNSDSSQVKIEKSREYEQEYREKYSTPEVPSNSVVANQSTDTPQESNSNVLRGNDDHHLMGYEQEYREKYSTPEVPSNSVVANQSTDSPQERNSNVLRGNDDHHLMGYEQEYHEKYSTPEVSSNSVVANQSTDTPQESNKNVLRGNDDHHLMGDSLNEKPAEEVGMLTYQRKVLVLYELLSACLAADDTREDSKKYTRRRKGYDARHRVALRLLTIWFDIEWIKLEGIEMMVAYSAMAIAKEKEAKGEESQSPGSKWAKWKRRGIIGAAAVTGGTLMAITGGLAAPAIAAGFGALAPTLGTLIPVIGASGFAAAASAAGTVAGSVAVAASFGAAGAGLTGSKMARRTGKVDEFEFIAIGDHHNQGRLAVEILISGFVFNKEDYIRPWEGQINNMERFVLLWESQNLIAVSTAIQDWLTSSVAFELMRQGAMMTVLSSLVAAFALPAVLYTAANFIDSKMSIAVDRSDKAGRLLAEVLLKGYQGNRPVTLIGYSLGARVIFKCLEVLSETEQNAELVERVVLLGAPIAIKGEKWEAARKMVAGRFINAYSSNDWMLGVAFRASLLTKGLAGIQPVNVPGIENVNVTDMIEGHSSYLWTTRKILDRLELEVYYPVFKSDPKKE